LTLGASVDAARLIHAAARRHALLRDRLSRPALDRASGQDSNQKDRPMTVINTNFPR